MIEPAYIYRAKALRVVDGDTYEMQIDLGFKVHVVVSVRLHGWSCPELSQPGGIEARHAARELLAQSPILVQTYKDQQTFARWVADVFVGGRHVGELLAALGHAVLGAKVGV